MPKTAVVVGEVSSSLPVSVVGFEAIRHISAQRRRMCVMIVVTQVISEEIVQTYRVRNVTVVVKKVTWPKIAPLSSEI